MLKSGSARRSAMKGNGMAVRFALGIIAVVVLLALIVVVAPGLIPVSVYKPRLEAAASEALGRKVTIGDKIALKIFPKTAFHVSDLVVADADGFEGPYLARVKAADIGVKLAPLFHSEVEIERFVLDQPDIRLTVAADGRVNWNLAQSAAPASDTPNAAPALKDIRLGDVRLIDGKASYTDKKAGKTYALDKVNATAKLKSLKEPLEIAGDMLFQGAPTKATVILNNLAGLLAGDVADLKLDATIGATAASADLHVSTKDGPNYSGPLKLNIPDLPAFMKILGTPLQEGPGFDVLQVEGTAKGDAKSLALSGATIRFDKIDASGDLALDWSGARPKASGNLAAGALDLRPYLPPPAPEGATFPAWSTEKIDFSSLRNIDALIDVSAKSLALSGLNFGQSRMRVTIDAGKLSADIPTLGMYGGVASGRLVVDARGATPAIQGSLDATKVIADRFAKEVLRNDRLLGVGGFKLQFAANGASQAAIMRSLSGKGGFDLADGALKGVNLAKLVKAVDDARKNGLNAAVLGNMAALVQAPDEKTDYSQFLSAFTITNGVLTANTISLKGALLTMTGGGIVNIGGQTIDLRIAPRAVASADNANAAALAIPVKIGGTFAKPTMAIGAETLLRGRIEQGVSNFIGKALGGGKAGGAQDALSTVLGGGTKPASADGAAAQKPEDAVAHGIADQLFGKKKSKPADDKTANEPAPTP